MIGKLATGIERCVAHVYSCDPAASARDTTSRGCARFQPGLLVLGIIVGVDGHPAYALHNLARDDMVRVGITPNWIWVRLHTDKRHPGHGRILSRLKTRGCPPGWNQDY